MASSRAKTLLIALVVLLHGVVLPLWGGGSSNRCDDDGVDPCCCAAVAPTERGCCDAEDDADPAGGGGRPGCPCLGTDDPLPMTPPAPRDGFKPAPAAVRAMVLGARLPELAAASEPRPAPEPRARVGPSLHVRHCVFLI